MWKFGCLVTLIGVILTFGSCVFLGTAARKAASHRQVANYPVTPGETGLLTDISVDPDYGVQISLSAQLEVSGSVLHESRERSEIMQFSAPVNYRVLDEQGEQVSVGAGTLSGSTILPEQESAHFSTFDPEVKCTYRGETFLPPDSGSLRIEVKIPAADDEGNRFHIAHVEVFDRVPSTAGRWALGGFLSMIAGPILTGIGILVFLIGLIVAGSKRRSGAPAS